MNDWEMSALARARLADRHAEAARARLRSQLRRPEPDENAIIRCLVRTYATIRVAERQ